MKFFVSRKIPPKLGQLILIIFGLIVIISCETLNINDEQCNNKKELGWWTRNVSSHFKRFFYCPPLVTVESIYKPNCQSYMKHYLQVYPQSAAVLDWYARTCTKFYLDWEQCLDIVKYFQQYPYCWTMESLSGALSIFGEEKYMTNENYKRIKITKTEFDSYKTADLNIQICMEDLDKSFDNTIKTFNTYITMWDYFRKEFEWTPYICNCVLVLGINKLATELQNKIPKVIKTSESQNSDGDGDNNESILSVMYHDICFTDLNDKKPDLWTRERLDVLIAGSEYLDVNNVITLLNSGTMLVEKGWYTKDKPETHWALDYLLDRIKNSEGELVKEGIEFIAKVIEFGFSEDNYDDYLLLLHRTSGFAYKECELGILKTLMGVSRPKEQSFWKYTDKKVLLAHLETLTNMFISSDGEGCQSFVTALEETESVVKQCPWEIDHTNKLIELASTQKMSMKTFSDCLLFCASVSKVTDKFNNEKADDWPPSDEKKVDFRVKLFSNASEANQICNNEKMELIENSFYELLTIYKKIWSWEKKTNLVEK